MLRSLAPEYKDEQHATYVRHLEAAVEDRKNKNVALTGPYGSGKSSILDRFLEKRQDETVRISISTLGPDDDDDLTNRIQKELVKQLVYRAEPGEIRRSRFARRKELTKTRAFIDGAGAGVVLVGLLWLFGVRPDIRLVGTDLPVLSLTLFLLLVVGGAWAVRWAVGDRLISQFSTGSTSISLDTQPDSYFDKYLDEIVAFFDATEPRLVVFEDLDRFDDPQIFDSLRELNTLINASAHWKSRDHPLRFVYAIKDSLFEKLGEKSHGDRIASGSTPSEGKSPRDAAEAAVERADRTKFFEVVIPVVPFLSHSNARDLLSAEMEAMKSPEGAAVSRGLIDIVARHAADMRLMLNIRNEFVVFAQRLLWIDEEDRAPGLTADTLFALVVYKNFHLADFERLPHRGSVLDKLERQRRNIVTASIAKLHEHEQTLLGGHELHRKQEATAQALGDRLNKWVKTLERHTIESLSVGNRSHKADEIHTSMFWKEVAETGKVQMQLRHTQTGHRPILEFKGEQLNEFFPEAMEPNLWDQRDDWLDTKIANIQREIARLRGADFAHLAKLPPVDGVEESFPEAVNDILPSRLARDLVLDGYLSRYYAEYSAVFYGDFLGVDVANYFRNCVWPNEMDVEFPFKTANAVRNVLEQAPEDFTRSRSALNIQVVDHLLKHDPTKAEEVVDFLITGPRRDRTVFLNAFLKDADSRKEELLDRLAALPWSELFNQLASPEIKVDEAFRTTLVDWVLLYASDVDVYDFDDEARALIIDRHAEFSAFSDELVAERTEVVVQCVHRIGLIVPSLQLLSATLRRRIVTEGTYELTADNLRSALGLSRDEPITLDRICENEDAWRRCREDITGYLIAASEDGPTEHTVLSPERLIDIVDEQHENWTEEQLADVLESSAPEAALPDITEAPPDAWPALARAHRIEPSATNVLAYTSTHNLDATLGHFLELIDELQHVDQLDPEDRYTLAVRLLNSPSFDPAKAVDLTRRLDLDHGVTTADLTPRKDGLLAYLLEAALLPDERATFAHFIDAAGWPAVSRASVVSKKIAEFVDAELVSTVVADLLEDEQTSDALKAIVAKHLDEYVTDDGDFRALRAAGHFARLAEIELPLAQIERVADADPVSPLDVVWQLNAIKPSSEDLMRLLTKLGGEYSGFGKEPEHKFEIPDSGEMGRILSRLARAGRIKYRTTSDGRRRVRILP